MKNKTIKILSSSSDSGKRIDIFLSQNLRELTRSNIKKLINLKKVTVNNVLVEAQSKKIKEKDIIKINYKAENIKKILPSYKPIDIVYEDKDIIIVNKPQGMVVHPGAGNKIDTLVNILLEAIKRIYLL